MKEEPSSRDKSENNIVSNIFGANADLAAVLLSTLVIIAVVFLPYINESVLRPILSIIIVIFNPGYAFTAALFPRKDDLSNIERITLALGLGVAIVPLLAFVLAYNGPMSLASLVGVLTLFVTSCSIVGLQRRRNLALEDRFTVEWHGFSDITRLFPKKQRPRDRILSILLVVSLLLSTAVVVYAVITPNQSEKYTEFYIFNSNGEARDYPTELSPLRETPINVGVTNHEGYNVTYDLVIGQNESSQLKTLHSEQFTVNDNGQWEKTILLKPDALGNNVEFKFLLYKQGDATTPYRETHLFANVTVKAQPQVTLSASTTTPPVGQPVTLTATLKNGTTALSSKPVTIYHYINGVHYTDTTQDTNAAGQITFTQSFSSPALSSYYASFAGDGTYASSTSSSTMTINVH